MIQPTDTFVKHTYDPTPFHVNVLYHHTTALFHELHVSCAKQDEKRPPVYVLFSNQDPTVEERELYSHVSAYNRDAFFDYEKRDESRKRDVQAEMWQNNLPLKVDRHFILAYRDSRINCLLSGNVHEDCSPNS